MKVNVDVEYVLGTVALEPCPSGCTQRWMESYHPDPDASPKNMFTFFRVLCPCGWSMDAEFTTEEEAAAAWNRRPVEIRVCW